MSQKELDIITEAMFDASKKRLDALDVIDMSKIQKIMQAQGQSIEGIHNMFKQFDLFNGDPNASILFKGEKLIYIPCVDHRANRKKISLKFNETKKPSNLNLIPLIMEGGLSAEISKINPDEYYITIKKELFYEGDYNLDAPLELNRLSTLDKSPLFYILSGLFLYINDYGTDEDKYDKVLGLLDTSSYQSKGIGSYLKNKAEKNDMTLKSIEKSDDANELYITITHSCRDPMNDMHGVPEVSKDNGFNVDIYTYIS